MLCPNCKIELKMSERERIEVDYCPQCRGVWLDRGELDKIIERSAAIESAYTEGSGQRSRDDQRRRDDDDDHYRDDRHYGKRPYKKKSFLGELLDF